MNEYQITNTRTGAKTWVVAMTTEEAIRSHETARRAASGEACLSPASKIGHDNGDGANIVNAWIGDSAIRGAITSVVRSAT